MLASLARPERVVEVGPKVVAVFEPDRQPQQAFADPDVARASGPRMWWLREAGCWIRLSTPPG